MQKPPLITIQLVHIQGPRKGEIQELDDPAILFGRSPDCQVSFPKDLLIVSRKHAEIIREGNRFKLIDHSINGTFVNGKRVKEAYLKDGDVLLFAEGGPKVSFLTRIADAQPETGSHAGADAEAVPPQRPAEPFIPPVRPERSTPRADVSGPDVFPGRPEPGQTPVEVPIEPYHRESGLPGREAPQNAAAPPSAGPGSPFRPSEPPPGAPARPQTAEPSGEIPVQRVRAPLTILYGPTLRTFNELPVILGSGPRCDLILPLPGILEEHALFFHHADRYWVKDLTGRGTLSVNGQPVHPQAVLEPNCTLRLTPQGPAFRFLGEGRLAEFEAPVSQEPQRSSAESPDSAPSEPPDKSGKGPRSILKKFWSR